MALAATHGAADVPSSTIGTARRQGNRGLSRGTGDGRLGRGRSVPREEEAMGGSGLVDVQLDVDKEAARTTRAVRLGFNACRS